MRITSLNFRNYRNHRGLTLDLAPLTILAGPKGSGKTSVLYGLAALICGRNVLTDARGVGLDEQIRSGAEEFILNAAMAHAGRQYELYRRKPLGHSQEFSAVPHAAASVAAQQGALLAALDVRTEVLLALFDIRPLLARTLDEQRAEILSVIQPPNAAIAIPPQFRPMLFEDPAVAKSETLASMGEVETLYQRTFSARTLANRRKKDLVVPPAPVIPDGPVPAAAQVSKDIAAFRAEIQDLRSQEALIEGRRQTLRAFESGATPPIAPEGVPVDISPLEADRNRLVRELDRTRAEISTLLTQQDVLRQQRHLLLSSEEGCFVCHRRLTARIRSELLRDIDEQIEDFTGRIRMLQEFSDEAARSASAACLSFEEACEINRKLENAQAAHRAAVCARTQQEQRIRQIAGLSASDSQVAPQLEALRLSLETRLRKAEEVLSLVRDMERRQADYAAAIERFRALDARCADLDALCDWLGPNGIRLELFQEWIGPFLAAMQGVFDAFEMGRVAVDPETFRFTVGRRAAAQLSEGEQLIFEYACRLALAQRTGLLFVALDSASHLDAVNREILIRLSSLHPEVQTIVTVTLAHPGEAKELAAAVSGAAAWWFNVSPQSETVVDSLMESQ